MSTTTEDRPVIAEGSDYLPSPNMSGSDEGAFLAVAALYAAHGNASDAIGQFAEESRADAVALVREVIGLATNRLPSGKRSLQVFSKILTALAKSENPEDALAKALQCRSNLEYMADAPEWARMTPKKEYGFGSSNGSDIGASLSGKRPTRADIAKNFRAIGKAVA